MENTRILKKIYLILSPPRFVFALTLLIEVLANLVLLAVPIFIMFLFEKSITNNDLQQLNVFTGLIAGTVFLYYLLQKASDHLKRRIRVSCCERLSQRILRGVDSLAQGLPVGKRSGDLLGLVTYEIPNLALTGLNVLPRFVFDCFKVTAPLAVALLVDIKLALLGLIPAALYVLETRLSPRKIPFFGITYLLWATLLGWYLGNQIILGTFSIGKALAAALYFVIAWKPAKAVISMFFDWKKFINPIQKLCGSLDLKGKRLSKSVGIRVFNNPKEEIVHDVDVKFTPGSLTTIVGNIDSDKLLLPDLIRFFEPNSRIIFIDNSGVTEIKVTGSKGKLSFVSQEAKIFDGTIMDNLLYGNEGLERGDAMRAARIVQAHNFIEKLTGGYDASTGHGGDCLSCEERLRVAIARILLRNPSAVIFDETNCSMNSPVLADILPSLKQTKSVIVIGGNLAIARESDNILFVENGIFVEQGKFDNLTKTNGPFHRYYWRHYGDLAIFKQRVDMEFERMKRYSSKFCIGTCIAKCFDEMLVRQGSKTAHNFVDVLSRLLKKNMRLEDSVAVLEDNIILLLLPEIDNSQLGLFFVRIKKGIENISKKELGRELPENGLLLTGTCISKLNSDSTTKTETLLERLVDAARANLSQNKTSEIFEVWQ